MITFFKQITDTKTPHYKPLSFALDRIKNPKKATKALVDKIRSSTDQLEIDALKKQLPCVLFSGTFNQRADNSLIKHSGYIVLDFDMEDAMSASLTKSEMMNTSFTYAAWISPSGKGVKALFKIKYPEKHKEHFNAIKLRYPSVDISGINVSRVCYESYDESIYINEGCDIFDDYVEAKQVERRERMQITETLQDDFEKYKRILKWLESRNDAFVSGQRNQFIFKLAAACCRFGIDQYVAEGFIEDDFLGRDNDFTRGEAEKTIASAYRANGGKFNTEVFEQNRIINRETLVELNPKVLEEGYKLTDVIYGEDVWEQATTLYENGYASAETTHIPQMDDIFKWKSGFLYILTGIGNHGKSEILEFMQLVKSYYNGDKWAVYSPENYPPDEWYFNFCERLAGTFLTPDNKYRVSFDSFTKMYDFVKEHFFYVYPEQLAPTPQNIKSKFLELIITKKVNGVVVDPINQMQNSYDKFNGRDDKYLEAVLGDFNRFAKENSVYFVIVAHPHKMQKSPDGNYPMPDVFDLAGGAMFNNKADVILVYHRPFATTEPNNPVCLIETKKVKKQRLFKRGQIEAYFDYKKRRFMFDGNDPLSGNRYEDVKSIIVSNDINKPTIAPVQNWYDADKDEGAPF